MLRCDPVRKAKPPAYPDYAVYAEFAADALGLAFAAINQDGLVFSISSTAKRIWFGGGRCSYYPQNTATASTLAADKYLSAEVLRHVELPTLGGQYFFLNERHRAHRPCGHERDDAIAYFHALGKAAFVKPLNGSRGDFAQAIHDESVLLSYIDAVGRHYDSIVMQPIVSGNEYRVFVIDDQVLYSTRKQQPFVTGDGITPLRDLLAQRDAALLAQGISGLMRHDTPETVLPIGVHWALPGRMNRSAGGDMTFETPPPGANEIAIAAVNALGLRVGGVDLFTNVSGDPTDMRVIEINANPSIRFLEEAGRHDLILAIWRHTFTAMGLLDV